MTNAVTQLSILILVSLCFEFWKQLFPFYFFWPAQCFVNSLCLYFKNKESLFYCFLLLPTTFTTICCISNFQLTLPFVHLSTNWLLVRWSINHLRQIGSVVLDMYGPCIKYFDINNMKNLYVITVCCILHIFLCGFAVFKLPDTSSQNFVQSLDHLTCIPLVIACELNKVATQVSWCLIYSFKPGMVRRR